MKDTFNEGKRKVERRNLFFFFKEELKEFSKKRLESKETKIVSYFI